MSEPDNKPKNLNIRRKNRAAAVQFLYMWEMNPGDNLNYQVKEFLETLEEPKDYYSFAYELIHGCIEHLEMIDEKIKGCAENWRFDRIAKVDLSILRLAIYELLFRMDIPPIVSINEAIELTKMFSHEDAKRFVNGILDKIKKELNRPLRESAES